MTDDGARHLPPGVRPDLTEGGSLPGAWTKAWRTDGRHIALSTLDGVSITAEELEERSAKAAGRFQAAGITAGQRVFISARASIEVVVAYVGALRAGLAVVPANSTYTPAELRTVAEASNPALAVLDEPSTLECPGTTPDLRGLPDARTPEALDFATSEDTALIMFTSGTTGRPKGVPLSHGNLLASAHAVRLAWQWQPDDTLALCLPLFHMHGLGVGLTGTLVAGARATIFPKFDEAALAASIRAGATLFFGVPTMYYRLADSPYLAELSGLRLAVSGSAPLPAELHERIRAASGQAVLERYGMTETGMLLSNPYDGERRPGTVGFALPGVQMRLEPLGSGTSEIAGTSEIQVRGPNVMSGYLDNPAATDDAFTADGWFRTGDLATLDADGYVRICGRAKQLIITGGYNVHPREVEEVLQAHPAVKDIAVVGRPDLKWGEVVTAFVVLADGDVSDLSDVESWAAQRLAAYKRPRAWHVVDAIPRNALGKVLRHKL